MKERFILWLARGFGLGLMPVGPGTFGTLIGLFWFGLLLGTGSIAGILAGTLLGLGAAVYVSSEAEQLLGSKDPSSVVIDEYTAYPLCYLGLIFLWSNHGALPAPEYVISKEGALLNLAVFAAFRLFDIAKPWPIKPLQKIKGGFGVVIDDVAAALAVNIPILLLVWWRPQLAGL